MADGLRVVEAGDATVPDADELRDADVVHVVGPLARMCAVLDEIGPRLPVVVTLTDSAEELADTGRADEVRDVAGRARAVLVRTTAAAVALRRAAAGTGSVVVVPQAVDLTGITAREAPPATLGRWLHVARGDVRGAVRAVRALGAWRADQDADARLTVLGEIHDPADELRRTVDELGLGDVVTVETSSTEDLGDVADRLAAADLLLDPAPRPDADTALAALAAGVPVLVTASERVRDVLDVAQDQWTAWLLPDEDEVSHAVAGLRGLTARLASARFDVVRADLEHRFAPRAVEELRQAVLRTGRPPGDGRRFRVVAVSLGPVTARRATRLVVDAVRYGGQGVLVTHRPGEHAGLDPRVEVVDVSGLLSRLPTHVLDRLLLDTLPGGLLRVAARAAEGVGRGQVVREVRRRYRRAVRKVRRVVVDNVAHHHIDPLVVARHVMRRRRAAVVPADLVAYLDFHGIPLAARIAEAAPGAEVVRVADHTAVVALARAAALAAGAPLDPPGAEDPR